MAILFKCLVFTLVYLSVFTSCQTLSPAPSVANYLRRIGLKTAVLGDWLYLDGGEVSQLVNGEPAGYSGHWLYKVNHTLSIPLRSSWTTESVTWKSNKKAAPVTLSGSLWSYQDTLVSWGGTGSYGEWPVRKSPWQFVVDGNGGGEWSIVDPSNRDVFIGITRTSNAAAATCNGRGLAVGGWAGPSTDPDFRDAAFGSTIPIPGLITYDMQTKTWANESAVGLNQFGTSILGSGVCLEEIGGAGVFFVIGGDVATHYSWREDGSGLISLREIHFWDVDKKRWHSQLTTGETPPPRDRHCLGSARGLNNTYEIYLYGGYNPVNKVSFDDVWILSIPAFTWFRADTRASTQRQHHSCQVVGNQMISVGGTPYFENVTTPDEWSQGIGILNLTNLAWTNQYQAHTTYEGPQTVREWYNEQYVPAFINT
ncbi:putative kelch repeat protein [Rosellinia necatrix]|uniref:Putative kelch repeat protein n=1 Tax=Rosellinia necatrix TaxID=77044 RepID=A0A1W2TU96_ROSNE|nr:putative kelch repeat protein [Rosellinia necatrix]